MKLRLTTLLLATLAAPPAISHETLAIDPPPALRKGLWEYKRTVPGQGAGGKSVDIASTKCADPAASFKSMKEMMAKQGCKLEQASVKGNVRTTVTVCPVSGGTVRSENIMTITSDSAYSVRIDTTRGGKTSKQTLEAKRVGDC